MDLTEESSDMLKVVEGREGVGRGNRVSGERGKSWVVDVWVREGWRVVDSSRKEEKEAFSWVVDWKGRKVRCAEEQWDRRNRKTSSVVEKGERRRG